MMFSFFSFISLSGAAMRGGNRDSLEAFGGKGRNRESLEAFGGLEGMASGGKFNYSKCPLPSEFMSEKVKEEFDFTKMVGAYYELAFHDWTQYPACVNARCVQAVKEVALHPDGSEFILDKWSITCFDINYEQDLYFNLTEERGHMKGYWPYVNIPYVPSDLVKDVVFPDTVVDFKEGEDGTYEWVVEIQCNEKFGHVWFVGVNFYSKVRTQQAYDEMYAASVKAGIKEYMENGFGLRIMDHSNCKYPIGEPSTAVDWPNFGQKI